MFAQPLLQGVRGEVGQSVDPLAGLGVGHDGGVAVTSLEREVIHSDHPWDRPTGQRQAPQMVQRGTAGNGHGQQAGQAGRRPAAQLPCHLGNLPSQPYRAALMALQQSGNLLAEGLPSAAQDRAGQPSYAQVNDDLAAVDRHVRHRPAVIPMGLRHAAIRTPDTAPPHPECGP